MLSLKRKISFRYDNKHKIETKFYGFKNKKTNYQDISLESLLEIIDCIPDGITELVCHPGFTNARLKDPYQFQRKKEMLSLMDPKVKSQLEKNKITLINFKEYKELIK